MRRYVPRKKDYSIDLLKEAVEKVKNRGKHLKNLNFMIFYSS